MRCKSICYDVEVLKFLARNFASDPFGGTNFASQTNNKIKIMKTITKQILVIVLYLTTCFSVSADIIKLIPKL